MDVVTYRLGAVSLSLHVASHSQCYPTPKQEVFESRGAQAGVLLWPAVMAKFSMTNSQSLKISLKLQARDKAAFRLVNFMALSGHAVGV